MATTASAVINTTDTATDTPTVPDASVTTKWQEYIWVRHLAGDDAAAKAKVYAWNPNATSVATYLKWQEITAAGAFSDLTGTATIAQLPTGITISNLSIDGAITNTHLAGAITNANLAGGITYGNITSVNANTVTSVSGSKIPVDTIPTLTNTNIDTVLGSASVDYDKLNIDDDTIPGAKIKDGLVHGQISSVSATTITTGTLPPARLAYMFERNLPIDSVANATGTYNLHTELGTASATFEGIIRVVVSASSNEVIIALPNPSVTAYNGKAAKLSIYRGSSTGKVTIKVCNSGTDSSAFATNKIVDNNNGVITDQVIVLPQLGTATARKIVIDLLADQLSGDGQWIVTGGSPVTGKGKVSVSGFRVGGGVNAPPEEGAQISNIGLGGASAGDAGSPIVVKINDDESTGENVGIPVAKTARVQNYKLEDPGDNYTAGQKLTISASGWTEEMELIVKEVNANTIYWFPNNRTKSISTENFVRNAADTAWLQGIYGGTSYQIAEGTGQRAFKTILKFAASNTVTTTTPNPHAVYVFWLEGIQPLGNDGNVLTTGAEWYDPWTGRPHFAP